MKSFKDKVAVVTGAASGIGWAIAQRCAREGMQVVLADVEEPALIQVQNELAAAGARVVTVQTDVSKEAEVKALAQQTLAAFGAVHLLFNNAGVGAGGTIWESTLADWQWVIGVNLWGVIHGLRVFVPIMLAQDTECHIVNTASLAGLVTNHPSAPYLVTKHAVVGLSEHLYHSLANTKVKVSVLCPGWVNTRIMDSDRNRPPELQNEPVSESMDPEQKAVIERMRHAVQAGISPTIVADRVFEAILEERFYILTHPEANFLVQKRTEDILQQRNPEN